MGITACSKQYVKPNYPTMHTIEKIPKTTLIIERGAIVNGNEIIKMIKSLRVSEHYYFTVITKYNKFKKELDVKRDIKPYRD